MSKFEDRVSQAMQDELSEIKMRFYDAETEAGVTRENSPSLFQLMLDIKNEVRFIEDRVRLLSQPNEDEDEDDSDEDEDPTTDDSLPEEKGKLKRFFSEMLDDAKWALLHPGRSLTGDPEDELMLDDFYDKVHKGIDQAIDKLKDDAKAVADLNMKLWNMIMSAANALRQQTQFQNLRHGQSLLRDDLVQVQKHLNDASDEIGKMVESCCVEMQSAMSDLMKEIKTVSDTTTATKDAVDSCCASLSTKLGQVMDDTDYIKDVSDGTNAAVKDLQPEFDSIRAQLSSGRLP